jgi:stage III sporulation protein AH
MKANFILGKKQIILASLVLILSAAVYLNWHFASNDQNLDLTEQLEQTGGDVSSDAAEDPADAVNTDPAEEGAAEAGTSSTAEDSGKIKILGDAQLVDSKSIAGESYFTMAKLARTKSRDAAIQTLAGVLDSENLTEADKKDVTAKAVAITDVIEAETRIENLVKAKGFEECVVYITETSASVVVRTDGLTQDQATQIKNIVVSEGGVKGENISITEVK